MSKRNNISQDTHTVYMQHLITCRSERERWISAFMAMQCSQCDERNVERENGEGIFSRWTKIKEEWKTYEWRERQEMDGLLNHFDYQNFSQLTWSKTNIPNHTDFIWLQIKAWFMLPSERVFQSCESAWKSFRKVTSPKTKSHRLAPQLCRDCPVRTSHDSFVLGNLTFILPEQSWAGVISLKVSSNLLAEVNFLQWGRGVITFKIR